jgi:endonuclease I
MDRKQERRRKAYRMWRGGMGMMGGLLIALAALNPAQAQVGFDRLGGDYASFPQRSGDPAQCAARCNLLAQIARSPACRRGLLRFRRARCRRRRAAQ